MEILFQEVEYNQMYPLVGRTSQGMKIALDKDQRLERAQ
jgi:hypothetical protein